MLKLIFRSKQKNDRRDAQKLAKLLYFGEVPEVHVPKAEVRAWREMIAFRRRLIEKRTRAKNGIRGLLRAIGLVPPKRPGPWSSGGMKWLKELTIDSPMRALKRDLLVDEIERLSRQIDRVERELERFSKTNPAVQQLQTIPGSDCERRKRLWPSSMIHAASPAESKWVPALAWCRRRTNRVARTDWATSLGKVRPPSGAFWPRRPGRGCDVRQACGATSNESDVVIRTARKSPWWQQRITSRG